MKSAQFAATGLAISMIMMISANGQQQSTAKTYEQALKTASHAYSDLKNSLFGRGRDRTHPAEPRSAPAATPASASTRDVADPEPVTVTLRHAPRAVGGLQRARYRYAFSGKLNILLPGMRNTSYSGTVVADGPPDYDIVSYSLDIAGLTSGWVLAKSTNAGFWIWDRPQGNIRLEVTIATPRENASSPCAATYNRYGTFFANYTFSTRSRVTAIPLGSPGTDKVTMVANGTTYVTHDIKTTAVPIPQSYPGVALDVLGIRPGMDVASVRRILTSHYKIPPRSVTNTVLANYRNVIVATSQPYVRSMTDGTRDYTDRIVVLFGNPGTGNTVVSVGRELMFRADTAPTIGSVMAALNSKYGPQTGPIVANQPYWVFGEHGLLKSCSNGGCQCNAIFGAYTGSILAIESSDPKGAVSAGEDVCIDAQVVLFSSDSRRISELQVILSDPADALLAHEEGTKEMHEAAVADYRKVAKPEKVPAL